MATQCRPWQGSRNAQKPTEPRNQRTSSSPHANTELSSAADPRSHGVRLGEHWHGRRDGGLVGKPPKPSWKPEAGSAKPRSLGNERQSHSGDYGFMIFGIRLLPNWRKPDPPMQP